MCRTDPRGIGRDASIVREVAAEIDRARGGDTVRAAVYQWSLRAGVRRWPTRWCAPSGAGPM
ncbi:hypothetical protein GCM10029992_62030 [Glycomyces albus]